MACTTVYRITGDATAADVADALAKPIRIVFILLVAWLAVLVARAIINRFVPPPQRRCGAARHHAARAWRSSTRRGPRPNVPRVARPRSARCCAASASVLIWSIAVLTILDEVGVNLAPLLAGAGIAGIALGFGAQSLVRDFLSGLFMFVEDQYGVGDVIDVGLATGTVEALTLRTTRLRDVQGVVWHVPNGEIHRVGNKSKLWSRAVIDVAIRYDADVDAALDVISEAANTVRRDAGVRPLHPRRARRARHRVAVARHRDHPRRGAHPSSGGGAGGACAAGPDQGRARRGRDLGAHGVGTPSLTLAR